MRLSTGFHIEVAIASKDDILRAINKYYDIDDSVEEFLNIAPAQEVREQEKLVEDDSPIVRLVNQILQMAVEQRASDIHIDPQETKVVIRYRIDGILRTERALPKHMQGMLTARIKF